MASIPGVPNRKNLDEYQISSGRMRKEDGDAINVADEVENINNEMQQLGLGIGAGSVFDSILVGTVATPLRVGAVDLQDRHRLLIHNFSVTNIFIGFDDSVTPENGLILPEGTTADLKMSLDNPTSVFAVANEPVVLRVGEVKN